MTVQIQIPEGVHWPRLTRDSRTGDIDVDTATITAVADANPHIDWSTEDAVTALLVAWYRELRKSGFRDPVQEQVLAEMDAEDSFGAVRVQIGPGRVQ